MRSATRTILLATLAGLLAAPLQAQNIPGQGLLTRWEVLEAQYRREVLMEIQPRLDAWLETWSSRDANRFADLYTEDAQLYFGSQPVVGRKAIKSYFEETVGSVTGLRIGLSDFYVSDRLAFGMGTYAYQVMQQGRPTERVENIFIVTFQGHGSRWHIRTQLFRDPLPIQ